MAIHSYPHRGTIQFPLNNRLRKENVVMCKIRIRVEWSYEIIKTFWKQVIKHLCFKLDQNSDLCLQTLRAIHLLSNFRICYRGISMSDLLSFSHTPPSADEHINDAHIKIYLHEANLFKIIFYFA